MSRDFPLVMIDLDNTLADRTGAVATWCAEFVDRHRLGADATAWLLDLDRDGYRSRAEFFAAIEDRWGIGPAKLERSAYQRRVVELVRPCVGAAATLAVLGSAGHRIAIVTNGSSSQRAKIERLGFEKAVDTIIVSDEVGVAKPDAAIFRQAADAAGSDLRDAWMVGDSAHHDIVGAAALGIRTVWCARGRAWDASIAPPDHVIERLDELPQLTTRRSDPLQ